MPKHSAFLQASTLDFSICLAACDMRSSVTWIRSQVSCIGAIRTAQCLPVTILNCTSVQTKEVRRGPSHQRMLRDGRRSGRAVMFAIKQHIPGLLKRQCSHKDMVPARMSISASLGSDFDTLSAAMMPNTPFPYTLCQWVVRRIGLILDAGCWIVLGGCFES
ncbi:hypothetical protein EDD37DRAFT_263138 [Exophiala viscosa]|uniref:uncharacterized protein n=1 Tax=Exophiala viscosa TaxID=2486360 RepID=UPI002196F450|nr:hypothetical protein EDD37DRAFT_263138 [Exophiala viscosa]